MASIAEDFAAFLAARGKIDEALDALDAISPDIARGPEAALRDAIMAAVAPLDVASVTASLKSAMDVVRAGGGIVGGGADSNLA